MTITWLYMNTITLCVHEIGTRFTAYVPMRVRKSATLVSFPRITSTRKLNGCRYSCQQTTLALLDNLPFSILKALQSVWIVKGAPYMNL
jgi:hypothetical protein